jgi:glutamine amidotransferase PdxT
MLEGKILLSRRILREEIPFFKKMESLLLFVLRPAFNRQAQSHITNCSLANSYRKIQLNNYLEF